MELLALAWIGGGLFLGWSLGANHAANVFGTAVGTRTVKWITAAMLIAVFVPVGAVLEGAAGMETLGSISPQTIQSAFVITFSAALMIATATMFGIPCSTSQAVVGGILGVGFIMGFGPGARASLIKVLICWVSNPIAPVVIAAVLYTLLGQLLNRMVSNIFLQDRIMKWGLILAGVYGSYALGANNVANVTGLFKDNAFGGNARLAALVGSLAIGVGALTFSRRVMETIGGELVPLEPFSALIAVLAEAVTVHIFAFVGVPVSTSVAIVGGVVGVGLAKGMNTLNVKLLRRILAGWVISPIMTGIVAYLLMRLLIGLGVAAVV